MSEGSVVSEIANSVGTITFSHPKSNSLPSSLLNQIAQQIDTYAVDKDVKVVVLKSSGEKAFCAGASFDELTAAKSLESSKEFFSGFGKVISAIRNCPKFVIARVQGKVVGGGVGIVSACDYALATEAAAIRLSELSLGIGAFVIGPAVERKIGLSAFSAMSIDTEWRDASWAQEKGLFNKLFKSISELDQGVGELVSNLERYHLDAMIELKKIFWEGVPEWNALLNQRAETVASLAITEFVQNKIESIQKKS